MLLTSANDVILVLGVAAAILLALALIGGILAAMKTFQVRQFQDLLFKAERKIDTLERRMFNVLNAVPVALVETDTTGKFTFANKSAHQLLGRKDSELIGLRFHSATWGIAYPDGRIIPPDLMPIARTLRGQTVKGFQHLLVNHGSHEKVLVSVTSMPILNNMSEVIGTTSAMVELETQNGEGVGDLTGLWRGQWFAAATVPFWGLDAKGQILDINNAALDAFDMKREQALGQNWTQFFVDDADFKAAMDYLADAQDGHEPGAKASATLNLKTADGQTRSCVVTAWVVRTHEDGDRGLTVMAMSNTQAAAFADPLAAPASANPALSVDDALELEDLRHAEEARATLGVGVWQYDAESDSIVEDAGMMALIGRDYEGGPTLISSEDQAVADREFTRLMSGESDHIAIDIKIVTPEGPTRWITLKGQARPAMGGREREIFGVAFDSTEWKLSSETGRRMPVDTMAAAPLVDATPAITQADLDAARQQALDEAKADYEAALDKAKAEMAAATPAPVEMAPPEPVIIREPDPEVVAENENLKQRLESLQIALDRAEATHDELHGKLNVLSQTPIAEAPTPEPVVIREADPQVAAENADLKARLDALHNDMQKIESERGELQDQLDSILLAPRVVADANGPAERIESLQTELQSAQDQHAELKARFDELAARPAPQPDTSEWEGKLSTVQFELAKWQAAYQDAQHKLEQVPISSVPLVEHETVMAKLDALQQSVAQSQSQQGELQKRLDQVSAALSHAQRFETVGRLTNDVAQDFAQMLGVINGALEIMTRQPETPENVRRLSEAALAAGKRGERLTRQLQAFQSEEF